MLSIRFVTRRTAVTIALACAAAASVVALALGAAIGMHWAEREAAGRQSSNGVEREYVVDELGKLNASVAQIEPRIAPREPRAPGKTHSRACSPSCKAR